MPVLLAQSMTIFPRILILQAGKLKAKFLIVQQNGIDLYSSSEYSN
jgi:hypothetical protein